MSELKTKFPYQVEEHGAIAIQHKPPDAVKDTTGLCAGLRDPRNEREVQRPTPPMRGGDPHEVVPAHGDCHAWLAHL